MNTPIWAGKKLKIKSLDSIAYLNSQVHMGSWVSTDLLEVWTVLCYTEYTTRSYFHLHSNGGTEVGMLWGELIKECFEVVE